MGETQEMICPICNQPYNENRQKIDWIGFEEMCFICFRKQPETIAIDFDATLAQYSGWKGQDHKGDPMPGVEEFLKELKDLGYNIVVYTARQMSGIADWLEQHNLAQYISGITNQKIAAFCYIDDRAIQFNADFNEVLQQIKEFEPWWKK